MIYNFIYLIYLSYIVYINKCYNDKNLSHQKEFQMTAISTQQTQTRSLLGTRIVLDEKKILRENKYDLDRMYEIIDKLAKESGLIKIDKHTYHCKGNEKTWRV